MMDLKQRTKMFSLRVIRLFVNLPRTRVTDVIGTQCLRSATSVGAHYREATRARSNAEFISKLSVGQQELEETAYWFELMAESGAMKPARLANLLQEVDELSAIFTTCIKNARKKEATKQKP